MRIHLRRMFLTLVLAGLTMIASSRAYAGSYTIQGLFGNADFTGPLNGGSFSGTFTVAGLPVSDGSGIVLTDWNVELLNASNTVLADITTLNGCAGCNNVDGHFAPASGDLLNFMDTAGDFLELQFADPFNGTGSVIPFASSIGSFASFGGIGGNSASADSVVTSGTSSAPEPAPVIFFATGLGLLALLRSLRRRFAGAVS